jgi:D-glucosaminate-6-phosphate ammonia-lyase
LVALRRFVDADDAATNAALESRLRVIAGFLGDGVTLVPAAITGRAPVLEIACGDAIAASRALLADDPPVHVSERKAAQNILIVDPQALSLDDDPALAAALRRTLSLQA